MSRKPWEIPIEYNDPSDDSGVPKGQDGESAQGESDANHNCYQESGEVTEQSPATEPATVPIDGDPGATLMADKERDDFEYDEDREDF